MTYEEWRKRTATVPTETLLKQAYQLLQEWHDLDHEQAIAIEQQKSGEYGKDHECWQESLPGGTMNFCNWGV